MPWCPKCKTEYRKGITVCVDCGTELVDEQPNMHEYAKLCTLEKEEIAKKLMKYFEYSKIDSHYEYEEAELGYVVYVRDDEVKKAKSTFEAFYSVELEKLKEEELKACETKSGSTDTSLTDDTSADDTTLDDESLDQNSEVEVSLDETKQDQDDVDLDDYDGVTEEEVKMLQDHSKITKIMYDGGAYEKKSEKLKDYKSTAATFFVFSIAGLIVVGLNLLGVINFIGGTLQYCILIALFVGFFFIGLNALKNIKTIAKEADLEEENTKKITEWLNTYVTEETLNEFSDSSLTKEANFMRVMDEIKHRVVKEFGQLDEAYLDYVTEEFYNNKFGENE